MIKHILKNKPLLSSSILKSSAGILLITMFVKVLGYAEKLILANYFGTGYEVDVYTVALTIVLSIFFFFREIIEPGYLNVFLDCKGNNKETESWGLFNQIFRLILFATTLLSVIAIFAPQWFSSIFAPGFRGEKLMLANTLIRIVIPAGIFLALSTLTGITLNGLKIFVLPASGELAFKVGIIACMIFFYKGHGIVGAAIGIVIGSLGRLGIHIIKLYKRINFRKTTIEPKYKKRIWQLTWPLLLGVSFSQISGLVDNIFASYLQQGTIAALAYAKKVVELPVILFPYVVSIVIFPYFTQLSVEKKQDKLKNLLIGSLKWIVIAFIPVSIFFIVYPYPIIEIIFQRGAFDPASTLLTSKPFMVYSTGLVVFAIETILVIFYYSCGDTKTPVFVGIFCVILNMLLTWLFIHVIGYIGIALAYVVQKVVKNLILIFLLKQKISYNMTNLWSPFWGIVVSSIIFILFIALGKMFFYNELNQSLAYKIAFMALNFSTAGLAYFLVLQEWGMLKIDNKNLWKENG